MQVDSNLPVPSQSDAKRCGHSSPRGQSPAGGPGWRRCRVQGTIPAFFTLTIPNEVEVKSPQIRRNSLWINSHEIEPLRSATSAERSYLFAEASATVAERSYLLPEASARIAECSYLSADASAIVAERSSLLAEASAMNGERSSLVAEASAKNDEASAIGHEGSCMIPARSPGSHEASAPGRRRSNRRFNQRCAGTSTNR